jgi:hypothetical protein
MADLGRSRNCWKKQRTSEVAVKRKLRRLSTVGSHELKKAAGNISGAFFLCQVVLYLQVDQWSAKRHFSSAWL